MSTPVDPPVEFSVQLRAATVSAHQGAEQSPFMSALLAGELGREGAAALTAQLFFVYRALELAAAAKRDTEVSGQFVFDELTRLPSLEADLTVLVGADWPDRIVASAATQVYVDRLEQVATGWCGLFIAHHYTRYLGDLSGGRIIGRRLQQTLDLPMGEGLTFYEFTQIPKPALFKDRYRALLNSMSWDSQERERVIQEVLVAYRLNADLLGDLDAQLAAGDHGKLPIERVAVG